MPDDLWNRFGAAAAAAGSDRSAILRAFMRWYVREADARAPRRPDVQLPGATELQPPPERP